MLWQAKKAVGNSYTDMPTPSEYNISWEDLDKNSYRSVATGNLVRSRVSSKWFSGSMTYNYLTKSQAETILDMINADPLYVKIKSPLFGTSGFVEMECYVSKASIDMHQNTENPTYTNLKFNIVQSQKIGGQ